MLSTCRSFRKWYKLATTKNYIKSCNYPTLLNSLVLIRQKQISLFGINFRTFCTAFKRKKLSLDLTERLRTLQIDYEKDPQNINNAYKYFKELNRVGLYQVVVRLYHKNNYDDTDKLKMQYDFAVDHLNQMRGLMNTNQLYPIFEDKNQNTTVTKYFAKRVFQLLWKSLGLFLFVFIVTMIIKNINSRSLLDVYNFDLK